MDRAMSAVLRFTPQSPPPSPSPPGFQALQKVDKEIMSTLDSECIALYIQQLRQALGSAAATVGAAEEGGEEGDKVRLPHVRIRLTSNIFSNSNKEISNE